MRSAELLDLDAPSVVYTPTRSVRYHPQSPRVEVLYETDLISVTNSLVSIQEVDKVEMETNR